jgi:hypothetical protein
MNRTPPFPWIDDVPLPSRYDKKTWEEVLPLYVEAIARRVEEEFPRDAPVGKRPRGRPGHKREYFAAALLKQNYEFWLKKIGRYKNASGFGGPYARSLRMLLEKIDGQITAQTIIMEQKYPGAKLKRIAQKKAAK